MNTLSRHAQPSFEEVYAKAPFADLVRVALSLADRLAKLRARLTGATPAAQIGRITAR